MTLLKRRMRRNMVAVFAEVFHVLKENEENTLMFLVQSSWIAK